MYILETIEGELSCTRRDDFLTHKMGKMKWNGDWMGERASERAKVSEWMRICVLYLEKWRNCV